MRGPVLAAMNEKRSIVSSVFESSSAIDLIKTEMAAAQSRKSSHGVATAPCPRKVHGVVKSPFGLSMLSLT